MIARMWSGETLTEHAERYDEYLKRTGVPDARATPGNEGVLVLRRVGPERAVFTFISFWDSIESIRAFAGDDIQKARYYPEDRAYLLELTAHVEHWDVIERGS